MVTFADIEAAAERIWPLAKWTPEMTSHSFNREAGARTVFKCENFQTGGAFKIRGASNLILSLTPDERKRGVIAYSSGNHAQATAIAARHVGAKATIVMPEDAPRSKREGTEAAGGVVVTYGPSTKAREEIAADIQRESGATLVPPFDHPLIIAGQGTAGLELIDHRPDCDAIITPVGGGGLLSGCATAAKALKPSIRVFGAEPENASDTAQSFRKGERVRVTPQTIADGLRSPMPGEITFPIVQRLVEDILTVSEDEIRTTVKFLMSRLKIVVEPSGAVAAAAVLFGKLPKNIGTVGVVISGGNVDLETLATL